MPKPRPLTSDQARGTLAHRFTGLADKLRQLNTKFGLRPYRVFLTWTRWTGEERGEGSEVIAKRLEILPTPKVESLDSVVFSVFHAGTLPVGSLRVSEISAGVFTEDMLRGYMVPREHENHVPEPVDFFYEVVEDGRGDPAPMRARFRLLSTPMRRAGNTQWQIMLERVSEDRDRDDRSRFSPPGGR